VHQVQFRLISTPNPAREAYSSPDPIAVTRGGKGAKGSKREEGQGRQDTGQNKGEEVVRMVGSGGCSPTTRSYRGMPGGSTTQM